MYYNGNIYNKIYVKESLNRVRDLEILLRTEH